MIAGIRLRHVPSMPFAWADALARRPWLVYLVASLAIMANSVFLGPFSYLSWHDLGDSHISRYVAMVHRMREGAGIALWYPEAGAGVDILANGARYFDGFFVLFSIMPTWLAIGLLRFIQMMIAGVFMQRLLREQAKLTQTGAFVGGLVFLLIQGNLLEFYFGVGALPLILWALGRLHDRSMRVSLLGAAALGAAWSLFSFFHLTFLFCLPAMVCWLYFVAHRFDLRMVLLVIVLSAVYTLFQIDMLAAMLVNSPFSHRIGWDLTSPPWNGVSLTIWDRVVTSVEFFVLAGIAIAFGARSRFIGIVLALIVGTLIVAWLQYEIRIALPDSLNAIKGFNMYRFVEFLPVLWAAAIGWGWQAASVVPRSGPQLRGVIAGVAALVTILLVTWTPVRTMAMYLEDWVKWGSYFANYRNPQMIALAHTARASEMPFRVATIQEKGLLASYASSYGLESADSYLNLYPYRYNLLWRDVIAPTMARDSLLQNYVTNYGPRLSLFTDDGTDYPKQAKNYFNLDLLSLLDVRYIISKVPIEGSGLTLVSDTQPDVFWTNLSVREKIVRRLSENFEGRSFLLYENANVLPRWFFVQRTEVLADDNAVRARMVSMSAEEFRRIAVLNAKNEGAIAISTDLSAAVVGSNYGPDRIALDVQVPEASFLVLSNSYSPYWVCRIDGQIVPMVVTDLALWGAAVPAGARKVEFTYEPPYRLIANDRFYPNLHGGDPLSHRPIH